MQRNRFIAEPVRLFFFAGVSGGGRAGYGDEEALKEKVLCMLFPALTPSSADFCPSAHLS